jgi:hypothetical protein
MFRLKELEIAKSHRQMQRDTALQCASMFKVLGIPRGRGWMEGRDRLNGLALLLKSSR